MEPDELRKRIHSEDDSWEELTAIHSRLDSVDARLNQVFEGRYRPFFAAASFFIAMALAITGYVSSRHTESEKELTRMELKVDKVHATVDNVHDAVLISTEVVRGHIRRAEQAGRNYDYRLERIDAQIHEVEKDVNGHLREKRTAK